ncbi:hypothetical protein JL100_007195 [Skermanella mucosa]|uniref:hypothetical protein n=1 Tax=Skermanella mucosa TaxID=1789672 RepID=UPI00192C806E|nr:hypothetical protein [Skermanella mucosa]UEM22526.1 hypothetical protein JL100_007195 [Skermanella mucosa]
MRYLPTIDLTPQVSLLLSAGALHLQPGQWVTGDKGVGRYLRTDRRTGTTYVSWVRPGDDWKTQSQRFHRACMKGYVGKYGSRHEGRHQGFPPAPAGRYAGGHSAATL